MQARPENPADDAIARGFCIGELEVRPDEGSIAGPGGRQQLDPKIMCVLVHMAQHAGHVVPRDELLSACWPGVVVGDDALTRCFYELRRQLALAGSSEEFRALIETLPKRGYRLNAEVSPLVPGTGESRLPARRIAVWAGAALAAGALLILGYRALQSDTSQPQADGGPAYSIAVLPFVDMSEERDQGYFSDGTSEEILNRLAQSSDLRVIARTSSFTFRGRPLDITDIARRLDVTHVLEGSVRKSGDRVRVTAQLIAASDGSHVWSDTYDRKLGDVFAIQDEVAAAVAEALRTTLKLGEPGLRAPASLGAYELVMRGEYHYHRRAPGDIERSIGLFEQAVKTDPGYARAWADLAGAYSLQAWSSDPPSETLRAKQGNAALRAVELDPSLARAEARLAQYYWESGESDKAGQHLQRAFALDPNDPLVLGYVAQDALAVDDFETALGFQQRALLRDPLNSVVRQNFAVVLMASGRWEEALTAYRTLLEMNPHVGPNVEVEISRLLTLQGREEEAFAAAMRLPAGEYRDHALGFLNRSEQHREEADAALRRFEEHESGGDGAQMPEHVVMDSVRLAENYAFRGLNDKVFETLANRLASFAGHPEADVHTWYLRNESRLAPFLKPLRADPRWSEFIEGPDRVNR